MRHILFRGKRADNNQWVYGFYYRSAINGRDYIADSQKTEATEIFYETLGEFTGFYDKNGKKIFTDDIIEGNFSSYLANIDERGNYREVNTRQVKFIENGFYLCLPSGKKSSGLQLKRGNEKRFDVIGNIYDRELK